MSGIELVAKLPGTNMPAPTRHTTESLCSQDTPSPLGASPGTRHAPSSHLAPPTKQSAYTRTTSPTPPPEPPQNPSSNSSPKSQQRTNARSEVSHGVRADGRSRRQALIRPSASGKRSRIPPRESMVQSIRMMKMGMSTCRMGRWIGNA
jgi:hypothetical protein